MSATAGRVARGTTLEIAPPVILFPDKNRAIPLPALPRSSSPVGILVWATTRFALANPTWVFVFPISSRRIISSGHGDVAADDLFEVTMLGPQEQSAVFIERLRVAGQHSITDADFHKLPKSDATLLPLIAEL